MSVHEHESFGLVGFSRVSNGSTGAHLFASAILHQTTVMLSIHRAKKIRDSSCDRYFAREELVEVELSPVQFAELLTTMNVGFGVPCTIRYVGGKQMERCPDSTFRQEFSEEFKATVQKATDNSKSLMLRAKELLQKKTFAKQDKDELLVIMEMLVQDVRLNLPFIEQQFQKSLDHATVDAKSEVEAFFTHKIQTLGLQALQEQVAPPTLTSDACVLDVSKE